MTDIKEIERFNDIITMIPMYPDRITRYDLHCMLNMSDRQVRNTIEWMRECEALIIAHPDGGYSTFGDSELFDEFTDADVSAIRSWIAIEDSRARSIFKRTQYARKWLERYDEWKFNEEIIDHD